MSAQNVSQTLIKECPALSPNGTDNINTYFNITKQVKAINTKFSLYGIYMHSKSLMMQNSMIYSYSWNSLNVAPSVSFKPVSFMELYYTYSFLKNFTKVQNVSKSFLSQTHDINLVLQPVTNLQFKAWQIFQQRKCIKILPRLWLSSMQGSVTDTKHFVSVLIWEIFSISSIIVTPFLTWWIPTFTVITWEGESCFLLFH